MLSVIMAFTCGLTGWSTDMQTIDLQKMIDDAVKDKSRTVTLPAGRFFLEKGVSITNIHDLVIEGAGQDKTIIATRGLNTRAFNVSHCQRMTFRNFAVDRELPSYVQGTITAISDKGKNILWIEFQTHAGYLTLTDAVCKGFRGCGQFFDQHTRKLKHPDNWFGATEKSVERIDDTHGRIITSTAWLTSELYPKLEVGDFVMIPTIGDGAFVFWSSDSIRMEDVTILSSGSIGLGARFVSGDNFFRITLKRGPAPAGGTEEPLLTNPADGFQIYWCPGSMTFENCDIGYTGDDCIAVGQPLQLKVTEVISATKFLASFNIKSPYFIEQIVNMSKAGDIVRPERAGSAEPLGDIPLRSIKYEGVRTTADGQEWGHASVELDQQPDSNVNIGDYLVMRRFLPERLTIRNSKFHNTRGRGLLLMSGNGLVESNLIEHTAMAGIYVLNTAHPHSDWVSDLIIRNNDIRDTCFNVKAGMTSLAAILICSSLGNDYRKPYVFHPWLPNHRNISIISNTIDQSFAGGIMVNGLDGGKIQGNIVKHCNQRSNSVIDTTGQFIPVPFPITIMNSKNLAIHDNDIADMGPMGIDNYGDMGIWPEPAGSEVHNPPKPYPNGFSWDAAGDFRTDCGIQPYDVFGTKAWKFEFLARTGHPAMNRDKGFMIAQYVAPQIPAFLAWSGSWTCAIGKPSNDTLLFSGESDSASSLVWTSPVNDTIEMKLNTTGSGATSQFSEITFSVTCSSKDVPIVRSVLNVSDMEKNYTERIAFKKGDTLRIEVRGKEGDLRPWNVRVGLRLKISR